VPIFDDHDQVDVERTYDADPWPALEGLSPRQLDLYRELWGCTAPGSDVAHVRHQTLAGRVGLKSDRHVRRLMGDLYRRGLVLPIPQTAPMPGGGRRRVSNRYRLLVPLHVLPSPQVAPLGSGITAGRTVRTWPKPSSAQVAPLGHEPPCPSKNVSTEVSLEGEGAANPPTGGRDGNPGGGHLFDVEDLEPDDPLRFIAPQHAGSARWG
jgi:hypothetical protein